jgi:hypothetical protein
MNDKPLWWVSPSNQLYKSRMEAVTNGEQMITPLYTSPVNELQPYPTEKQYADALTEIELLKECLEAMVIEFRQLDLPYGSKAYGSAIGLLGRNNERTN